MRPLILNISDEEAKAKAAEEKERQRKRQEKKTEKERRRKELEVKRTQERLAQNGDTSDEEINAEISKIGDSLFLFIVLME